MNPNINKSPNNIVRENLLKGSQEWKIDLPATNREIEGYGSKTSINHGQSIRLFINTTSKSYSLKVFRMGWYGGDGGRLVHTASNLQGIQQITPEPNGIDGLIECDWKTPYILKTDKDWCSGVYIVKLEEGQAQKQSYIIFVLRNDEYVPELLFQLPVTTYQAYNYWGGKSLYKWGSGSFESWGTVPGERASRVSFNRPYAASNNPNAKSGLGAGEFFCNIQPIDKKKYPISSAGWDYNMVRWLEKNGYDVSYITNIDTHRNNKLLYSATIFISNGHDEYWSSSMRKNIENRIDKGLNLVFFSSNTMFWQVRFVKSKLTNDDHRTMVCFKDLESDPIKNALCTVNFRDPPINKPESALIGVEHFLDPVDGDMVVCNQDHWVFAQTGLQNGDSLKGLLGYEVDAITSQSPKNIEILCDSWVESLTKINYPALLRNSIRQNLGKMDTFILRKHNINKLTKGILRLAYLILCGILIYVCLKLWFLNSILAYLVAAAFIFGPVAWAVLLIRKTNRNTVRNGNSNMTIYESKSGAMVFSTGSMQWSWGLDDFNSPNLRTSRLDKRAEIITKNVLEKLRFSADKEIKRPI